MDISIDVHIFTSGMGGGGKTTAVLNTLSYFAKDQKENTVILVFDEGDNTDIWALWLPYIRVRELSNKLVGYQQAQLSLPNQPEIFAFQADREHYKGFNWRSFSRVIEKFLAECDYKKHKDLKVVVLVDTGGSLARVLNNAGGLGKLNKKYKWHFFPWILWTSNSLVNESFVETTNDSLEALEKAVEETGELGSGQVHPVYMFNPILHNASVEKAGFREQVISFFSSYSEEKIITINPLLAYKQRPAKRPIPRETFFELVQFSFVEAFPILTPTPVIDTYNVIGTTLGRVFSDEECKHKNDPCGFSNILCIGIYHQKIAALKLTPGLLRGALEDLKQQAVSRNTPPVRLLSTLFGAIADSYEFNLALFFDVLEGRTK